MAKENGTTAYLAFLCYLLHIAVCVFGGLDLEPVKVQGAQILGSWCRSVGCIEDFWKLPSKVVPS